MGVSLLFEGKNLAIALPDVQHVERSKYGLIAVTRHTRWDCERDLWANNAFIPQEDVDAFMAAWRGYVEAREARLPAPPKPKTSREWRTWKRVKD